MTQTESGAGDSVTGGRVPDPGAAARWLRALLIFVGLSHLFLGGGLAFSAGFQRWAVGLYGARVEWGSDTVYLIRIVGTFAVFVGLASLAAPRRPTVHRGIVAALALFFLLRSASRHLHAHETREGFRISPATNLLTSAFFVLLAVSLLGLLWWSYGRETVQRRGPRPNRRRGPRSGRR